MGRGILLPIVWSDIFRPVGIVPPPLWSQTNAKKDQAIKVTTLGGGTIQRQIEQQALTRVCSEVGAFFGRQERVTFRRNETER